MSDYGDHAGVVEIGGDEHRRIGIGEVVSFDQLDRAAVDSALGIDLFDGQFGRPLHRRAHRVGEGTSQADENRAARGAAGSRD